MENINKYEYTARVLAEREAIKKEKIKIMSPLVDRLRKAFKDFTDDEIALLFPDVADALKATPIPPIV